MSENKSTPIELVTGSEIFYFFNLVTRKRKNKGLTIELVTQSSTFCFSTLS